MGDFTLRVLTRVRRVGERADRSRRFDLPDALLEDPLSTYQQVTGGLKSDGEAASVGIGARLGLRSLDHGAAQELVESEQGPHLLLDAGRVVRAQDASVQDGVAQGVIGALVFPALMIEAHEVAGGIAAGIQER